MLAPECKLYVGAIPPQVDEFMLKVSLSPHRRLHLSQSGRPRLRLACMGGSLACVPPSSR